MARYGEERRGKAKLDLEEPHLQEGLRIHAVVLPLRRDGACAAAITATATATVATAAALAATAAALAATASARPSVVPHHYRWVAGALCVLEELCRQGRRREGTVRVSLGSLGCVQRI